jgi:hypothetical protein
LDRVRFVHRDRALVGRLNRQPPSLSPLEMRPPIDVGRGSDCWIAQTFIHLRRQGSPVVMASTFSWNEVNVVHYDDLLDWRRPALGAFVVAVQADRPRPVIAEVRVVQNQLGIEDAVHDQFIPHWSQPQLEARDPARGDAVTTLAYFGLAHYLAPPFRESPFRERLGALGVTFAPRYRPDAWGDYRDVDVVVAVREASDFVLAIKPATKLVNAWKAGCIPILGREPAYRQVGRPGVDYLEASTVDEVVGTIRWLREQPAAAAKLRREGARAFATYDDAALTRRWVAMLEGVALPSFEQWRRAGRLGRLMESPARLIAHRRAAASFWARVVPPGSGPV